MTRTILGIATLVGVFWFVGSVSKAQPQDQAAARQQGPVGWPREAKGYGKTLEAAQKSANEHAVERVVSWLKSQDPPLEAWQPDLEYVKKNHLVKGTGDQGEDIALVENGPKDVKTWIVQFKETPNRDEMVQLNGVAQRRQLSADRQAMAGYGLAALTALLATGWGYLRLDDLTKGRMSKWLAIGAVGLLGASGAIWWLST